MRSNKRFSRLRDCVFLRAKILTLCTLQHLSSQACSFFVPPSHARDVSVLPDVATTGKIPVGPRRPVAVPHCVYGTQVPC